MLRQAPEAEIFPLCAANGISQIVWSPLGQRLLTGMYRAGQEPPSGSRAASSQMNGSMDLVMNDTTLQAVDRLRPIADQAGLAMAELALAWVLRRPEVASAIAGATRPEQVHANASASGIQLTPDTLSAIDETLGDAPVTKPTLAPLARPGVTHHRKHQVSRAAQMPTGHLRSGRYSDENRRSQGQQRGAAGAQEPPGFGAVNAAVLPSERRVRILKR
jgi:hypothetical protein